jgi:uncharacterized RDD family membrane protein YckC
LLLMLTFPVFFLILISSSGTAIIPKEITIEDSRPWTDEVPEPLNEIARYDKRIFNFIADAIFFLLLRAGCFGLLFKIIPPNWFLYWSVTFLAWLLYYPLMELATGKTIAKYITRTRVVNWNTQPADGYDIMKRNLMRLIPFEWLSFLREYPTGWHDSFSDTSVVNDGRPAVQVAWVNESD